MNVSINQLRRILKKTIAENPKMETSDIIEKIMNDINEQEHLLPEEVEMYEDALWVMLQKTENKFYNKN